MKYILFLQDMNIPREQTCSLLSEFADDYELIWHDHPQLNQLQNDIEILVTSQHEVNASVLKLWPKLNMVSLAFTGYDKVDREYCESRSIKLYYVPDYSSDSVAELTIGLTLSVLRRLSHADQNTREGYWDREVIPGIELQGKKVGILGTGNIGIKSARLFKAFGCTLVGWVGEGRKHRQEFLELGFDYESSLDKIFAESDIVVLHLPVDRGDKGTKHIVGSRQLALMRPTSILINTARSELVDTNALVMALNRKSILGAGIDVFDEEPVPNTHPLMALNNVVLTPHIGFKTKEALQRLAEVAIQNIKSFLIGSDKNLLRYTDPE